VEVHQRRERPYNAPLVESNEKSSGGIISVAAIPKYNMLQNRQIYLVREPLSQSREMAKVDRY